MSVSDNVPSSSADARTPAAVSPSPAVDHASSDASSLEKLLARIGDRLNPILVKEARQALKSRQFTVTFSLLLFGAWVL